MAPRRRVPRLEPETIATLQQAARENDGADAYERFATYVNEVAVPRSALRGLLRFKDAVEPVPLEEVEPAAEIVKRFKSGGMSLGARCPRRRTRRSHPA